STNNLTPTHDQTQIALNPGNQKTWNPTGERQVHILGVEDKRAFTLLVAAAASGFLLPFQAIYTGKSSRSLPTSNAPGFADDEMLGFLLEYSGTTTYWSTFLTMCNWVCKVLVLYFLSQIAQHGLPADQRCILLIDCWSVHKSASFRAWIAKHYPWIILMYVPGNCTGLFQPCDVGLQRVLKAAVRNASHNNVVNETVAALQSGTPDEKIMNDQSVPMLRERSLGWILEAYHAVNKPNLVKKAFSLCAVPGTDHNLSYESLTSQAAQKALNVLRSTNLDVYLDLSSGRHVLQSEDSEAEMESETIMMEDDDEGCTVSEVSAVIMGAKTAVEATLPLEETDDALEHESEQTCIQTPARTRSGRTSRPSTRYQGGKWVVP
ncbi:hypothetical protein FRC07_009937, partial [Ceratobasidium sp. 392]